MKDVFKQMFKVLPKKLLIGLMIVAVIAGISAPVMATFGPDRPTKAWSPTVDGFDHVTFNSFTGVGNGVGDERDFLRGLQVGRDSAWSDPVSGVTQGAEVEAKIYIHNNADASLNDAPGNPGVAKNVNVRVALPQGIAQTQQTTAYISADNAQPGTVTDTLDVTGANNGYLGLNYEAGSAVLHNQDGTTSPVSDSLVTTGTNIGDQKGCFAYVREITFKMKVNMPRYTIQKQVEFAGQTGNDWKESVNAKTGDTLAWLVTFKNAGATPLNHVKVVDEVPAGLTVVPGTVKLTNGNYPNGYVYPDSAIQANGRQVNVDIGNYNPDAAGIAYVTFRTTVTDTPTCGKTDVIVNKAFTTPEGFGAIFDTASANITGAQCVTPVTPPVTPAGQLPNTGPGDVVGIFAAVTIAGAVAHRLFLNRRYSR
jgi:uncharacterized repeat protein (TIGR01451 family)